MSQESANHLVNRLNPWVVIVALFAITIIAYIPALSCGFIWDDDYYVTQNETLRDVDGLRNIWFKLGAVPQYYPLVHTTFWMEYQLWGTKPLGYHLNNMLLHALSSVLLWRLLARMNVPGAWLAAAIFAVHPVCVESVAWITERKNVLSGVLYLSAALAFVRFAAIDNKEVSPKRWLWYGLSIVFFFFALLSKTTAVTFPCAMLLLIWWRRGTIRWADFYLSMPFFLVAMPLGYITVWMEKHNVGADFDFSPIERVLIAGRALWFYIGKIVLPHDLTFFYPRWMVSHSVWWQYIFPFAFVGLLVGLWSQRSKIGRGPLAAVLFFAGTLVPALGFFDVYPMKFSFVADHFQYLASIGIITLISATFVNVTSHPSRATIQMCVASVVILGLGAMTFLQCHAYRDEETLYLDTIKKNEEAWIAHHNLGVSFAKQGEYLVAIGYFNKTIEILEARFDEDKHTNEIKPDYSDVYFNRGRSRAAIGEFALARNDIEQAIEIVDSRINSRISARQLERHVRLFGIRLAMGGDQIDSVRKKVELLRRKNPRIVELNAIASRAYLLKGDMDTARQLLAIAEAKGPRNREVMLTRALLKFLDGEDQDGQGDLLTVLQQRPDRKLETIALIQQLGLDKPGN